MNALPLTKDIICNAHETIRKCSGPRIQVNLQGCLRRFQSHVHTQQQSLQQYAKENAEACLSGISESKERGEYFNYKPFRK